MRICELLSAPPAKIIGALYAIAAGIAEGANQAGDQTRPGLHEESERDGIDLWRIQRAPAGSRVSTPAPR
jgi:hypothetical protein